MLVLKRHARALHELTDAEGRSLSMWLPGVTTAMHAVTACEVEYVIQLAEGIGLCHVHFHLMARTPDWPIELRGPRVFDAFGAEQTVPAEQQHRLVEALRAAIEDVGSARRDATLRRGDARTAGAWSVRR